MFLKCTNERYVRTAFIYKLKKFQTHLINYYNVMLQMEQVYNKRVKLLVTYKIL